MDSFSEATGVYSFPKYFDAINFNENNQFVLVSSNLTGKFWHGAIGVFNDANLAPNLPHLDYASMNEAGCVDVVWIDTERIAVATDNGSVDVWKLKESPALENIIMLSEHDDICSSVDVSKFSGQLLSGSYDNTIKLWDLEVDLSINTIMLHLDKVLDVAWCKQSYSKFASASEDGTIKVYDNRDSSKLASLLFYSPEFHPVTIDWIDENKLCVGFSNGLVSTLDLNNPGEMHNSVKAHSKSVNSVLHLENNLVASCADDMTVKVHQLEDGTNFHSSSCHTDYVQDLAFNVADKTLFSCAWDAQVCSHNLDFIKRDTS